MGSQRGSASVTEKQIERAKQAFKKKSGSKSPPVGITNRTTRGRKVVGSSGGGGGGGGGGFGGGGGEGTITDPGGPATGRCRHRECKCEVSAPAQYCRKYCQEAAASGSTDQCRCNHEACR